MMNQAELKKGKTEQDLQKYDIGRAYLRPYFNAQSCFANQPGEFGYDVLDCFPLQLNHIKIYPVQTGDQIILTSDGYPYIEHTLLSSERKLKELRQKDPLCIRDFVTTKHFLPESGGFDDRTYIRFTV